MSRKFSCPRRWLVTSLTGAALLASFLAVSPSGAADTQASFDLDAVKQFADCIKPEGDGHSKGDVLLLIDTSASLQDTDPLEGKEHTGRVRAAQALAAKIKGVFDRYQYEIAVSVATFAEEYKSRIDWTVLDSESVLMNFQDGVAFLDKENSGRETDYWTALTKAREELEKRRGSGGSVCQALAWFSDGRLDLDPRDESEGGARKAWKKKKDAFFDLSPDAFDNWSDFANYARGDYVEKVLPGKLCDEISLLRGQDVAMLGVGLSMPGTAGKVDNPDFDLMERLVTGTDSNGESCGSLKDGQTPGWFYSVDETIKLIHDFSSLFPPVTTIREDVPICRVPEQDLTECPHFPVATSPFINRISVEAGWPEDVMGLDVYLLGPDADPTQAGYRTITGLARNAPEEVDPPFDGKLQWSWNGSNYLTVDMESSMASESVWSGVWNFVFVDRDPNAAERYVTPYISVSSDVVPKVTYGGPEVRVGDAIKDVQITVDNQGRPVNPQALDGKLNLDVEVRIPGREPQMLAIERDDPGWHGSDTYTLEDIDLTGVEAGKAEIRSRLKLELNSTTSEPGAGGDKTTTTELDEARGEPLEIPIEPLPGHPSIGPDHLEVKIKDGVEGTVTLTVTEKDGQGGCAWIEVGELRLAPGNDPNSVLTPVSIRANEGGSYESRVCVGEGTTEATIPVTVTINGEGRGIVGGSIEVRTVPKEPNSAADYSTSTVSLAVTATMTNVVKARAAAILAMILGVLIPFGLAYCNRRRSARTNEALNIEAFEVEIRNNCVYQGNAMFSLERRDPANWLVASKGLLHWAGVGIEVRVRPGLNLFAQPRVEVWSPERWTAALPEVKQRKTKKHSAWLRLPLGGSWVVLVDATDTESGNATVVSFGNILATAGQCSDLETGINEDAPEVYQKLCAAIAKAKGDPPAQESAQAQPDWPDEFGIDQS